MPGSYSHEDYRAMLCNSYVTVPSMPGQVFVVSDVTAPARNRFEALLSPISADGITGGLVTVSWDGDNVTSAIDWSRPAARAFSDSSGNTWYVRPVVRRTRHKGVHPDDYQLIKLGVNETWSMSRVTRQVRGRALRALMFGEYGEVRGNGTLSIVQDTSAANIPHGYIANATDAPYTNLSEWHRLVLAGVSAYIARPDNPLVVDNTYTPELITSLARHFGWQEGGTFLYWNMGVIGRIEGTGASRSISLNQEADLLLPVVAAHFPEYEVHVNA